MDAREVPRRPNRPDVSLDMRAQPARRIPCEPGPGGDISIRFGDLLERDPERSAMLAALGRACSGRAPERQSTAASTGCGCCSPSPPGRPSPDPGARSSTSCCTTKRCTCAGSGRCLRSRAPRWCAPGWARRRPSPSATPATRPPAAIRCLSPSWLVLCATTASTSRRRVPRRSSRSARARSPAACSCASAAWARTRSRWCGHSAALGRATGPASPAASDPVAGRPRARRRGRRRRSPRARARRAGPGTDAALRRRRSDRQRAADLRARRRRRGEARPPARGGGDACRVLRAAAVRRDADRPRLRATASQPARRGTRTAAPRDRPCHALRLRAPPATRHG